MSFKILHASLLEREGFSHDMAIQNFFEYATYRYNPQDRKDKAFKIKLVNYLREYGKIPTFEVMKEIIAPEYRDYVVDIERVTPLSFADFKALMKSTVIREVGVDVTAKLQEQVLKVIPNDEESFNRLLNDMGNVLLEAQSSVASCSASRNIRESGDSVFAQFKEAQAGNIDTYYSGFSELDIATMGFRRGDVVFVAAPPKTGKTTYVLNWAYNAQVWGGYNVVYVSLEMTEPTINRLIHVIHSNNHELKGSPIDDRALKSGALKPEQEQYLKHVIEDYRENPLYGQFHIIPKKTSGGAVRTMDDIARHLQTLANKYEPDILFIDYPGLMDPTNIKKISPGDYKNQTINEIIEHAKGWDNSRGLLTICPWQINRRGEEYGDKYGGVYNASCLADCNAIERGADQVLTLWRNDELKAQKRLRVSSIVTRDNPEVPTHEMYADYSIKRILDLETEGLKPDSTASIESVLNI